MLAPGQKTVWFPILLGRKSFFESIGAVPSVVSIIRHYELPSYVL
jgi:hypothetical protein